MAIGLLDEQSAQGVDPHRYFFLSAGPVVSAAEVLMLAARDFVEKGDLDSALMAVSAAKGIAAHFLELEIPTIMCFTLGHLILDRLSDFVLKELIPNVPSEQLVVSDWEKALDLVVPVPLDNRRMIMGEWYAMRNVFLFPMLCCSDDPKYPSDPAALVDHFALNVLHFQGSLLGTKAGDWATTVFPLPLENDLSLIHI